MNKKRDWKKVLEDHAESGLSVANYCKSHGISQAAFYSNKKELELGTLPEFSAVKLLKSEVVSIQINNIHVRGDVLTLTKLLRGVS